MIKDKICIVIPIFKTELDQFEVISVNRCINILSDYKIHFIGPEGLKLEFYKTNFPQVSEYRLFNPKYFKSIFGYNMLMLSPHFYNTFINFEFMLVYQTDCYVFEDKLLEWAKKDYDFIGGIWFENYRGNPDEGNKIWFPGNGGLSLRKITSLYNLLISKKSLGYKKLKDEKRYLKESGKFNFFKWNLRLPLRLLGYKNNFNYLSKTYKENEDVFFMEASVKYQKLRYPRVEEAISFSWDRHPEYLYKKNNELPFACHAWYRNEEPYETNRDFWLKNIDLNE